MYKLQNVNFKEGQKGDLIDFWDKDDPEGYEMLHGEIRGAENNTYLVKVLSEEGNIHVQIPHLSVANIKRKTPL